MVQEFTKNVRRLFTEIATKKHQEHTPDAAELLAVLQRKVTLPINVIRNSEHIRLVYDNVTVELRHDLSSMQIVYNSDYQLTLDDLSSYDVHQLAEFVLSLERDIPRWRHIWMAENKVSKMRLRMEERMKSIMREMRTVWQENPYPIKDNQIQQYRLRYYNQKACQLMLNIGNPYWENKATEQEIFEECQLYHVDPPMETWCEEFSQLTDQCNKQRNEKERKKEEQACQQDKLCHLIQLKKQKIQALIKTMEFHPGFSVAVRTNAVGPRKIVGAYVYNIDFCINQDKMHYFIRYKDIDKFISMMTDAIKRINDIMPDLNSTLKDDTLLYLNWFGIERNNRFADQISKIIEELYSAC